MGDQNHRPLNRRSQPLAQRLRRVLASRGRHAHDDVIIQLSLDRIIFSGQQECVERLHAWGARQGHQLVNRVELALELVGFFVQRHGSPL